ncbi:HNH endonuclease family protein [Vibrio breoganii]|uniref:HNH endonuclease family protein n=1 Tax=Vibrio breoganii TaxID=553239 RepID=UPI000C85AE4C|nr:HNH endonuclease family protein [Vibrio breoganii]PMK31632.1 hypothetical protein BCU03_07145 [Vibrio breoganii]
MIRAAIAITAVLVISPTQANVVKLSNSGICHDTSSSSYNRTKNFTPFNSLEACLDSGGRLPKNYSGHQAKKSNSNEYSRSQFGHGWADINGDCQNARAEALISQSVAPVRFKTDKECLVVSGRWTSPFTGNTIYSASEIDIDHVVPLKWAWDHGADGWTEDKRKAIANDPANLIAVEASLNRQKGAKGIDEWLPPKNECQYILRFLRVKKTYGLQLNQSEAQSYQAIKTQYCG